MITAIITTYLLTVNGAMDLPMDADLKCSCIKHSRSVTCQIGNILTGYGIRRIVSTTGADGLPVVDNIVIECRE